MNQCARQAAVLFFALAWLGLLSGCKPEPPETPAAQTSADALRVASLVPSGTDLVIAMGAIDRLVAVSSYDKDRKDVSSLPAAGDYRTINWEKLLQVRAEALIVQFSPDKMPPGLIERAKSANIRLINIRNNTLDELRQTITQIGDGIGETEKAAQLNQRIDDQLRAVRERVAGRKRPKVLLACGSSPLEVAAGGTFLNDLLIIAGGDNALGNDGYNRYVTLSVEQLHQLDPDLVLHLISDPAPQVRQELERKWADLGNLRAVRSGRIHYLAEADILYPASRVGGVAERFASVIHPD